MKIAMISEHASPLAALGGVDAGGQNVHVASLATRLGAQGHDVEVYTRRDDASLPERVPLAPRVEVVHVDAGPPVPVPKDELLPHMDAFGADLLRRWSDPAVPDAVPDVVHAHFWMSGIAGLLSAPPLGIPLVQTFHALGSVKRRHQGARDTSPRERVARERLLCRGVDRIVATCSDEVAELVALGADPDRVDVVPCGVDIGRFRPGPRRSVHRHREPGTLRLLSIGRLVERKGVDTVIEALPDLPGAELVVAGGPPAAHLEEDEEARRLVKLADALGVLDRVRLVGSVTQDDVRGLMQTADVVVCDPWYEPFGIVPLEAAACGRPVVGAAVGGLLDSVVDGRTGLLVPPRDPAALAAALRRIADDPALGERLGSAARVRAERLYGWTTVAARTLESYERVVAEGRRSAARDTRTAHGPVPPAVRTATPTATPTTTPPDMAPDGRPVRAVSAR
ncbi:glycosyltransferase [Cellulosimicrobium sp. Marseille-Q4280]|uniref:glycosyltransferase n=1 Tax=Cellulosimicrobium sp. Marseille-Q4280 TaxID=2937992 RepID=UPI00203B9A61|nr:glycosyltransferase [Cellulosimicrobium sp. Marseille-Q4280]